MWRKFSISMLVGLVTSLIILIYYSGLEYVTFFRTRINWSTYLVPIIFLLIYFFKRKTLFFPTMVDQVSRAREAEMKYWHRGGGVFNLIGSWLSHAAGSSLGREGTVIVTAMSFAQAGRLDWNYFRPITLAVSLSAVLGHPALAVIILFEVYRTNFEQKVFAFFSSWLCILILRTLGIPDLLGKTEVVYSGGFIQHLIGVVLTGFVLGIFARFYKETSGHFRPVFQKKWTWGFVIAIAAGFLFALPYFRPVQGLSLESLNEIRQGTVDLSFIFFKFIFTLIFVTLGFIGGEFVPSVIVSAGIGVFISRGLGLDVSFGYAVSALGLFAGLTRLKWTAVVCVYFMGGWSAACWAYLGLSLILKLSGKTSLYFPSEEAA